MHSQLEDYLTQVAARLGALPVARREDEIKEMRQHLLNAAAVNRERGQPEDQVVASALAQFGTPEEASGNVIWAWRRDVRKQGRRSSWRFAAIWTAFYAFQVFLYGHSIDARHIIGQWSGFWVFTLLLALFPHLPPKYQPAWLPPAWRRRCFVTPAGSD